MKDASYWIAALGMQAHPEGGFFKEVYRSDERLPASALPARFGGERAVSTSIYFLLRSNEFSSLHRIQSDEIWHFYDGASVTVYVIDTAGRLQALRLGRNVEHGERFQAVVKAGSWFGATVASADSFALVGCTVAPGFDFADFELAKREDLLAQFPEHRAIIERLTR
ncbi:MAG: hypothetical protein HY22_02185 [[Candidatus Thermochlorobacteriaceae] bacterium GBChlB]|nr:MAG: hypothetical protein HY22_02185 [[Candidatus Thermochlorobacteriaceae] bacterium GBChlB]